MGVEYRHYVLPSPRAFRPDPEQLLLLLEAMVEGRWIRTSRTSGLKDMETWNVPTVALKTGGYYRDARLESLELPVDISRDWLVERLQDDVQLTWPVGSFARSGLRYPLTVKPNNMADEDIYYELSLQLAINFIYRLSECIEPFETANCTCGQRLEFESMSRLFYSARLWADCPACKKTFDPDPLKAVVVDGWTLESHVLNGGATSRFALVIDCGKAIPSHGGVAADPDLVDLCERTLSCKFEQVGTIY